MSSTNSIPVFDKDASLALKGIAIILMMIHHNFRDVSLYSSYNVSFMPFTEHSVVAFAYACKICVSFFAFISGYGLYLSYKRANTNASKWVLYRYIKSFSGYWFVWVVSAIICQAISGRTTTILLRDGLARGIVYAIIDFIGLHNLFSTPSINGTWWYMSAALTFILLTPVLYRLKNNIGLSLVGIIFFIRIIHNDNYFPGGNSVYAFLVPFILGAMFAEYNCFEKIKAIGTNTVLARGYKAILELWFIVLFFLMYAKLPMEMFWEFHFGLFPLAVIVFSVEYLLAINPFRKVLALLGKHSMNIFLIHTFIRAYYLSDLTYSWGHFILITLFLLSVSLLLSFIIETLKKVLKYNEIISRLLSCVRSV